MTSRPTTTEATETPATTTAKVTNAPQAEGKVVSETTSLTVPASANADETAAIAVAVGAHLRDRAAARTAAADAPAPCDRWKLRGRLGGRKPPREVSAGEEWKAAARSR